MLVSYACKYSDVINCETSELLPTAVSPSMSTLNRHTDTQTHKKKWIMKRWKQFQWTNFCFFLFKMYSLYDSKGRKIELAQNFNRLSVLLLLHVVCELDFVWNVYFMYSTCMGHFLDLKCCFLGWTLNYT